MNDSSQSQSEAYWHSLFIMAGLAAALFAWIDFIPSIAGGPTGAVLIVIVGGGFLYLFGRHTGSLIAESDDSV